VIVGAGSAGCVLANRLNLRTAVSLRAKPSTANSVLAQSLL